MNTLKFTRVAMGVALATASLSAISAVPVNPAESGAESIINAEYAAFPPTFDAAQLSGLALLESIASLFATTTQDFGCATQNYNLSVYTVDSDGVVEATITGGTAATNATLRATLNPGVDLGWRVDVTTLAGAVINGRDTSYSGAHGWSSSQEIFNSDAWVKIKDNQFSGLPYNYYREVDIKDYFKKFLDGRAWEFDWGLEDVKKKRPDTVAWPTEPSGWSDGSAGFYYPVQKWHEASWFSHENGGYGSFKLSKYRVIPRASKGCRVLIQNLDGTVLNGSGVFDFDATIKVYRNPAVDL